MLDEMAYVEQNPSKYKNILEYKNPFLLNAWIKWGRNEKKNKWVIVSKTMAKFEICTSIMYISRGCFILSLISEV